MQIKIKKSDCEHIKEWSYYNHNVYKLPYKIEECNYVRETYDESWDNYSYEFGNIKEGKFVSLFYKDSVDFEYDMLNKNIIVEFNRLRIKDQIFVLNDEYLNSFNLERLKDCIYRADQKELNITKNSLRLSKKIYNELGLKVFPIIFRTYAGRNLKRGGAFVWMMYLEDGREVGSISKVSDFFKKDVELYVDTNWNDIEIGVDKNL